VVGAIRGPAWAGPASLTGTGTRRGLAHEDRRLYGAVQPAPVRRGVGLHQGRGLRGGRGRCRGLSRTRARGCRGAARGRRGATAIPGRGDLPWTGDQRALLPRQPAPSTAGDLGSARSRLPQRGPARTEARGADGDHVLRMPGRWTGGHGAELGDLPLAAELY
jgi:hypothetical protein